MLKFRTITMLVILFLDIGHISGAGSITSNLKSDKTLVTIITDDGRVETGLKKFGAMVGDYVEVGCGSVLNPGSVIGRKTSIYPLSMVRGYVHEEAFTRKRAKS